MVNCAMLNCSNRTDKYRCDYKNGVRFFSIPKVITAQCDLTRRRSERRRALWISKICRKDLQEADVKAYTKVCSAHFIKGAPSALWDENNPDWVPSQNLGYSLSGSPCVVSSAAHHKLTKQRAGKKRKATSCIDLPNENKINCPFKEDPAVVTMDQPCQENPESAKQEQIQFSNPGEMEAPSTNVDTQGAVLQLEELQKQNDDICEKYTSVCKRAKDLRDQVTNLEVDKLELGASLQIAEKGAEVLKEQIKKMEEELNRKNDMLKKETQLRKEAQGKIEEYTKEIEGLRLEVTDACVKTFTSLESFSADEAKVRFYTGLPSFAAFKDLQNGVISYFQEQSVDTSRHALQPWQCLLMNLMRLRLALTHQDLAYRFGVSKATVVRVLEKYSVYPALCRWLERETLWETMPREFGE